MYDKELVADILEDMIAATKKIDDRCSKVSCEDDFLDDEEGEILLDSICMLLIAVGEAVKQIDRITDKTLFVNYPEVEWKKVAGIRDVLSHHYFDLNAETVYGLCQKHIKLLRDTLHTILADISY
jgi:uncharacterized protein with HEPN domain